MTERGMSGPFLFHRTTLAAGYADALLGVGPVDRTSGLFLAGRGGFGKTIYIQSDLLVELRKCGIICTYTVLLANRRQDPAVLIADALASTVRDLEIGGRKAARKNRLGKPGLGNRIFLA